MFARNVRARDHGVVPPPPVPTGPGSGSDLLETKTTVCLLDNTVLKAGSILPSRTTHWADLRQVIEVGLTCLSLSRRHLRTDDYTNRHGEKVQEKFVVRSGRKSAAFSTGPRSPQFVREVLAVLKVVDSVGVELGFAQYRLLALLRPLR